MKQQSTTKYSLMGWLSGAAIGAAAMYLADPVAGKRRRALTRDKIQSLVTHTGDALDVTSRDFGNRVQGLRARARQVISSRKGKTGDDAIVAARVRSRIGRVVSHPHAIKVTVNQGRVTLNGPVPASEAGQLLHSVHAISGVSAVENQLQVHEQAEQIAGLQGDARSMRMRPTILRENWPPALRAAAAAGGGALGYYGLTRRTPVSALLAVIGFGMLARGISNQPLIPSATGVSGKRAIDLHKTIHIAAAPETVFDFWSDVENFPHFMSHVREVRDLREGRSHWIVSGPAGLPVEWTARLTDAIRPEKLAWTSESEAPFQHTGEVHFEPEDTGTRVSVHMSYALPAGPVGHALASLFSGYTRRQMGKDLARMKTFIETGTPPRDAAQPQQEIGAILH